MELIDKHALFETISSWPESVMYKDWVQSAIANAPVITPPPNEPLTLEELREMGGEPVYCVRDATVMVNSNKQKQVLHSEEWGIVASHELEDCDFIIGSAFIYHMDTYGKTCLAYRRKPEEGTA